VIYGEKMKYKFYNKYGLMALSTMERGCLNRHNPLDLKRITVSFAIISIGYEKVLGVFVS